MDYLNMDSNMLLSIINMKLRDRYDNLKALCDDLNISEKSLVDKLKEAGYDYISDVNQFK